MFPRAAGTVAALMSIGTPVALVVTDRDDDVAVLEVRVTFENIADHSDNYQNTENFVRSNPGDLDWTAWTDYETDDDDYMTFHLDGPLDVGGYVLAVQARDPAGTTSSFTDANVMRVSVARRTTGPALRVRDAYVGGAYSGTCAVHAVSTEIVRGLPVAFEFSASAEAYFGAIREYRYGWFEPGVPGDPERWTVVEVDGLPDRIEGMVPDHVVIDPQGEEFRFQVVDWSGIGSCAAIAVTPVAYAPSRDLLLVDDYRAEFATGWEGSNGSLPSDAEHDAFWEETLADVTDFDPMGDVIEVDDLYPLTPAQLLTYRSVVWSVSTRFPAGRPDLSLLTKLIRFRPEGATGPELDPTAGLLAQYLRAGGLLLIAGAYPLAGVADGARFPYGTPFFPMVYKYELDGDQDGDYSEQILSGDFVGDESFAYRDLCVNAIDYTNILPSLARNQLDNGCARQVDRSYDENVREAVPVDMDFPRLELRAEVSGPGRAFETEGLQAEIYNPLHFEFCPFSEYSERACFEPVYAVGAADPRAATQGSPVAFWTSASPYGGPRSAVFGVPPVYFDPSVAKEAIERVVFGEWGLAREP
jgi:hypothetical protein